MLSKTPTDSTDSTRSLIDPIARHSNSPLGVVPLEMVIKTDAKTLRRSPPNILGRRAWSIIVNNVPCRRSRHEVVLVWIVQDVFKSDRGKVAAGADAANCTTDGRRDAHDERMSSERPRNRSVQSATASQLQQLEP